MSEETTVAGACYSGALKILRGILIKAGSRKASLFEMLLQHFSKNEFDRFLVKSIFNTREINSVENIFHIKVVWKTVGLILRNRFKNYFQHVSEGR